MALPEKRYRTEGPLVQVFIKGLEGLELHRFCLRHGVQPVRNVYGAPGTDVSLWRQEDMDALLAWLEAKGFADDISKEGG